ncbi:MAG: hypothetical protein JETCAE02_06670 [Anaerolineaceae bacterium]|nr:MAG: hypothetical protein JETCAE02_06670 [Anaerolineaceae bacterium]
MTDLPPLSIVLATYKRTAMALETVRSTCEYLDYPKELRSWYVADDGSASKHFEAILNLLEQLGERVLGSHHERMRPAGHEDSFHAGLGWNKALGIAHQNSDFVLFLEDDWQLAEDLPLGMYTRLLEERGDVGMVSFRILSIENEVRVKGWDGRLFLEYLRSTQYSYSGNPNLRHARFTKHYGWFHEERSPGEIELDLDSRYRMMMDGPKIWRPLDISPWGAWHHIGSEKTWI